MVDQTGQVIINGDLSENFEINNGGKQGDPLFPLIFVIACEGLFAMLEEHPDFSGMVTPDPTYNFKHSGYADDTLIGISSESDIAAVETCLQLFQPASGQEVQLFAMWLGPRRPWYETAFNCPVLAKDKTIT